MITKLKVFLVIVAFMQCNNSKNKDIERKYYPNGSIEELIVYKDGIIREKTVYHSSGWVISYENHFNKNDFLITYKPNGDTFSICKNSKCYNFVESVDKTENIVIINGNKIDGGIQFDSSGTYLIDYTYHKDLLSKSDSLRLDKEYPKWKKQVSEYKKNDTL